MENTQVNRGLEQIEKLILNVGRSVEAAESPH
jgi:hypothetical protein